MFAFRCACAAPALLKDDDFSIPGPRPAPLMTEPFGECLVDYGKHPAVDLGEAIRCRLGTQDRAAYDDEL
jgi:hypothetical protein